MRREFGGLGDDRCVQVPNFPARSGDRLKHSPQQNSAINAPILRVVVRKMMTYVAQPSSTQQGVRNRMQERVRIGMPKKAMRMWNRNATQN